MSSIKKPSSCSFNFLIDGKLTNDYSLIVDKFSEHHTNFRINLLKFFMKGNYVQGTLLKEVNVDEIGKFIL